MSEFYASGRTGAIYTACLLLTWNILLYSVINGRRQVAANGKIPTFILHFGSKLQAESVWQPCKAALVLSPTWSNKYFAAAVRNTFVQSLQILLASGAVNRDISAVYVVWRNSFWCDDFDGWDRVDQEMWVEGGSINTFSTILWPREANSRKHKDQH